MPAAAAADGGGNNNGGRFIDAFFDSFTSRASFANFLLMPLPMMLELTFRRYYKSMPIAKIC